MKNLIRLSILFLTFLSFLNTSTKVYAQVSEQWAVRFEAQGKYSNITNSMAMAISDSGYVYITGSSTNTEGDVSLWHHDYCTIKYNQMGEEEWVAYYNPGNNYFCRSHDITVDTEGNVFVTGIIYNSDMWSFCTNKYNAAGELQWATKTVIPWADGRPSTPMAIDLDKNGNVFIMGNLHGVDTEHYYVDDNFIIIKYSSAGTELWSQTYDDAYSHSDAAFDMEVSKFGNVYVAGYAPQLIGNPQNEYDYNFDREYITIKYNTNGAEQWVATYNSVFNFGDEVYALVLDLDENVYITGESMDSTGLRCTTIKYNTYGQEQWIAVSGWIYNGKAIVLDTDRNVYVAGNAYGSEYHSDLGVTKINSDGQFEWERLYNATDSGNDLPVAIAIDDSSNIYVTGYTTGDSSDWDYATIKYNTFGEEQWSFIYNGTGNGTDKPVGIVVDSLYNVYVAGFSKGDTTYNDFVTIKYGLGDSLFPRIETSTTLLNFDSVAVSSEKSLSITIYSKGSLSLSISNILLNNSAFRTDYTSSVTTIIPGDSLVINVFFTPDNNIDYDVVLTIENNDHPVDIQLFGTGIDVNTLGVRGAVEQVEFEVYPNPVADKLRVRNSEFRVGDATVEIHDLNGRKLLQKQIQKGMEETTVDVSSLQNGLYFCRIQTQNGSVTKKLIIQR